MWAGLQDSTQSVMLTIDLREVLSRADVDGRVLAPRQGCNSHSDLEEWVVGTLDEGPECILGQRHTFRRRAAFATADPCLLDKAFNMTIPEGATVRARRLLTTRLPSSRLQVLPSPIVQR